MAKYKYRPDYKALYPGEAITDEVMAVLKASDRKMEYLEYDIKTERFHVDQETQRAEFLPSREDSLDRLLELDEQFRAEAGQPETIALRKDEVHRLRQAVGALSEEEQLLIFKRYWQDKSQQTAAAELGISQQLLSYRERLILRKLKNIL